jgi:hypothetical protein
MSPGGIVQKREITPSDPSVSFDLPYLALACSHVLDA